MRTDIYYWKCDNPLTVEQKRVYNDKYSLADISDMVYNIAENYFGIKPQSVKSNESRGNHYTYIITFNDRKIFFRADDGQMDDDYLDAENAVMNVVKQNGIPVPEIYYVDTSMLKYPVRYQLMEMIEGKPLNIFHQEGAIDKTSIGRQVGRYMAMLHRIHLKGFGFINTEVLKKSNQMTGIDKSHQDYFYKKYDYHLKYLVDQKFITSEKAKEIERLISLNIKYIDIDEGSLVHKDLAFWNMIGTPNCLKAIVDWDDVIIGDPVDDIAITRCFYNEDIFNPIIEGYCEISPLPENFYPKLWIYLIRNMIWKAVIRIFMNYFEIKDDLFILHNDHKGSLRQFTLERLDMGIRELKKLS